MSTLKQHDREIQANLEAWRAKPLLRDIYADFYRRILTEIDTDKPGAIVEIGSGMGNLKEHLAESISSDLFVNPWLDLACDAYALPFRDASLSHLILFDVFHHLRRPMAFLDEARRALVRHGRLVIFEPYISALSSLAYGPFHHEPIAWRDAIDERREPDRSGCYYAAQGNATRLFFLNQEIDWSMGWSVRTRSRFTDISYLLSGGMSRRALYPHSWLTGMRAVDGILSAVPRLFASRCLVCMVKE